MIPEAKSLEEGDSKMDKAIARLRASKEKVVEKCRKEGHEEGRRWAAEEAEYEDIIKIVKAAESGYAKGSECIDFDKLMEYPTYYGFLTDVDCPTPVQVDEETQELFWEGWVDGVISLYNEVRDEL